LNSTAPSLRLRSVEFTWNGEHGGGLLASDVVVISPQSDLPADFSIEYARVNTATQIRFRVRNNGTVAADPPSTVFSYKVIR
jgi:hypothetical protein